MLQKKLNFIKIYGITVFITSIRIIPYTPINLVKLCLYSAILFLIITSINNLLNQSRIEIK